MKILITSYGKVKASLLKQLAAELGAAFKCTAAPGPSHQYPQEGFNRKRGQHGSEVFLEDMDEWRSGEFKGDDKPVVLGFTDVDLYISRLNYIFGEADRKHRVAIISLHRLMPEFYQETPDAGLLSARALKEAIHETGHIIGLDHCDNPSCVMRFSSTIADTDGKDPGFCDRCQLLLEG
jgi:archaemetzincin